MASSNKVASHDPIKSSEPPSHSTEFQLRKYLLLLATLVATVTYAAGLNLPGGAWQEDTKEGDVIHHAGDLILEYAAHSRYLAFYYCNATAFAASLVVCLLLLVLNGTNTGWEALLRLVMVLDLLGLMGAYVAGSCRDTFTTIYSTLLVCAVFAYIIIAFSTYVISNSQVLAVLLPKKQDVDTEKQDGKHGEDTVTQDKDTDTEEHEDELREVLMLLATFAVTITYVAGLSPPGGFWGDSKFGHKMSYPVLQEHYASRYQAFYVCNTTAFIASLLIIILLVDKKLSSNKSVRFVALYGLIITALFGLMGAYAAGSCREGDDTTYVVCLIGGVLAYIFLQVALTKAIKKKDSWCCFHLLATIHDSVSNWLKAIRDFFASHHRSEPDQTSSGNTTPTEAMEKARSLVMLLATLVVSITYQAGLDPPGGLWSSDGRTADGRDYKNGDPILLTTHPTRYKVFFYSNSAAFVASLIVIIMVQSRFLLRRHTLEAAMILDLFGLISAYAAGSCRDEITSIYVVALAGIVLVYVVIHIIFFTLDHEDNLPDAEKLENRREVLLLLAILAATLTYQAGLTPPGGFWSDDKDGHRAGYPVLHDNYYRRYSAYFYCNAASFMASVALIVLLVNPNLYRPGIRCYALYVCMMVGMFGLMGAYAAGSARDLRTSIYVLTLVAAVFAFVALEVIIFWVYPYLKKHPPRCFKTASGSSDSTTEQKTGPQSETTGKTPEVQKEKNMREYLMLLGVLAASVTYQSGLKPPGGLWQDSKDHSGNPILHDINKARYYAFFYSNSTSFMASIVVVILLLPWTLHKHQLPLWPMQTAILLDMLGLLSAYAAGSTRDWETSRNVIYLVIPVLVYIAVYAAYAAVSIFLMKRQSKKRKSEEHKSSGND